jgi:biotin carboxyl carrier protein
MSKLMVTIENHTFEVGVEWVSPEATEAVMRVNGEMVRVRLPVDTAVLDETEWLLVEDRPYEIALDPDLHWLKTGRGIHHVAIQNQEEVGAQSGVGGLRDGRLKAPIPGLVTRVLVQPGEAVEAGQPVVVLEAMKMENEIRAPRPGVIQSLHVTAGQSVVRNELLAEIG